MVEGCELQGLIDQRLFLKVVFVRGNIIDGALTSPDTELAREFLAFDLCEGGTALRFAVWRNQR